MGTNNTVEHTGIIEKIDNNLITVRFLSMSSCASCHAKGACSAADMQEKEVEVIDDSGKYSTGEHVKVSMSQSLGFRALFLGYVLPFLILLIGLITFTSLNFSELKSGVFALALLVPYYVILYYSQDKLRKTFSFRIAKLD